MSSSFAKQKIDLRSEVENGQRKNFKTEEIRIVEHSLKSSFRKT